MILYTIMDTNYVLNTIVTGSEASVPDMIETCIDGVMVECLHIEKDTFRVERILSTNPRDYLNPHLQPGIDIKLKSR